MSGSGQGYTNVTDRGFLAFDDELNEGAWGDIATAKWEQGAEDSLASLLKAPRPVEWKIRLRFSLSGLAGALGAQPLTALDAVWDAAQRTLFFQIGVARNHKDPAMRAAGDRLATALLAGTGTQQTNFDFDSEVDFGRKQLRLTNEGNGPLHADAKKAGVLGTLADIKKATEDLAKGLGRGSAQKRKTPSKQLRESLAVCVSAFNDIHNDLVRFIDGTPAGADRETLSSLLGPLDALLARHEPGAAAPDAPETPDAADASATPDTAATPAAPEK